MKIKCDMFIILDLDGVLCGYKEYDKPRHKFWLKYDDARQLNVPYLFNKKCVKVLNEILTETDAEIVLSSDWGKKWTLEELDYIFSLNKIIKAPIDVTEDYPVSLSCKELNRINEIERYIKKHKLIDNYVVIDDLNLTIGKFKNRFIRTTEKDGIKQRGVKQKIMNILNKVDIY